MALFAAVRKARMSKELVESRGSTHHLTITVDCGQSQNRRIRPTSEMTYLGWAWACWARHDKPTAIRVSRVFLRLIGQDILRSFLSLRPGLTGVAALMSPGKARADRPESKARKYRNPESSHGDDQVVGIFLRDNARVA